MVHSTRTVSSDLARQLLGEMNEEESHCAKYYRSNLQLACKYIEEKAAISSQQRNTGILDQVLHKENTLSFQPDFSSSVLRKKNLVHIARRLLAKYLLRSLYSEMKLKADMNL